MESGRTLIFKSRSSIPLTWLAIFFSTTFTSHWIRPSKIICRFAGAQINRQFRFAITAHAIVARISWRNWLDLGYFWSHTHCIHLTFFKCLIFSCLGDWK
jgi:hypothetical protein